MSEKEMKRILVTGACGQIGTELTQALRERYGNEHVVTTDIAEPGPAMRATGPFEFLDVTQQQAIEEVVDKYEIDTIYHLAAILSATGERKPHLAWEVNIHGLCHVLEVARERELARVFCPSSIAVFGPETPRHDTPQETVLCPSTMYGVTKVSGELLGDYYFHRFGLDVRGIRYPGIISSETMPGGGTTDYAVEVFYEALENGHYTFFVKEDTVLPMMYMPDCIRGTLMLMEADLAQLKHHANFNMAGLSFSAGELAEAIERCVPGFTYEFVPDYRQQIADSWPCTIDDSAAREEWGWEPAYDLESMVQDMLEKLEEKCVQV
jgi:nucleoside-diphosphate-sugar epimerase